MNQAIYYVDKKSIDEKSIPKQAIAIASTKNLNKETLLSALAKAGNFPDYFAHNWDAAWDCLTDSDIRYLSLDLTPVVRINTEDFNTFKSIITDAYTDFGKPQLWIVVPATDREFSR